MGCEFSDKIRNFKRQLIQELFDKLGEKQQKIFVVLYGAVSQVQENEMYRIYYHCKRYLRSHQGVNKKLKGTGCGCTTPNCIIDLKGKPCSKDCGSYTPAR